MSGLSIDEDGLCGCVDLMPSSSGLLPLAVDACGLRLLPLAVDACGLRVFRSFFTKVFFPTFDQLFLGSHTPPQVWEKNLKSGFSQQLFLLKADV